MKGEPSPPNCKTLINHAHKCAESARRGSCCFKLYSSALCVTLSGAVVIRDGGCRRGGSIKNLSCSVTRRSASPTLLSKPLIKVQIVLQPLSSDSIRLRALTLAHMNLVLYIESIYKPAWREPNELDGKEGFFPLSIRTLVGLGSLDVATLDGYTSRSQVLVRELTKGEQSPFVVSDPEVSRWGGRNLDPNGIGGPGATSLGY